MIIILEGVNGVGKTTLAKSIGKHFSVPIHRSFRGSRIDSHWDDKKEKTLRTCLGIPANTYVDDFYVADFVTNMNVDVVIDRSLPSAIAYDKTFDQRTIIGRNVDFMLTQWHDIYNESNTKAIYFWLDASWETSVSRTEPKRRITNENYDELQIWFRWAYNRISFQKKYLNTDGMDIETTRIKAIQEIEKCANQK